MSKPATLLYFKHTNSPFETRDTASDVGAYITDQRKAFQLATAWENGDEPQPYPDGFRPGHGITILYASGRRKEIRERSF